MKIQSLNKWLKLSLAFILGLLTLISTSATVMAQTGSGTITVENTGNGATYTAYKIFDATHNGGGAVSYTIPEGKNYEGLGALFDTHTNGGKTYVTRKTDATDAAIAEWAKSVKDSADVIGNTLTGNGSSIQFTNLPFGYYYVGTTLSEGATVMVTSVSPNATIQEKNNEPEWGDNGAKTVTKASKTFAIGEEITYKLTYENATRFTKGEKLLNML